MDNHLNNKNYFPIYIALAFIAIVVCSVIFDPSVFHTGDAACVAMEEYGFLNAVRRQGVEYATMMAGVVRGVSDILEREGAENAVENGQDRRPSNAKKFASNTAAACAYWLIIKAIELKEQNI
jgi:hypothetical protein